MKVLMLTWNYPPTVGGIEQVAYHTATGLRRLGHEVHVVAAALTGTAAGELPADESLVVRARRKGIPAFLLHAVRTGWRIARREKPEVILCPSLTSAPAAWLVSRLTGIPYAILIHGSDILVPRRLYQLAIRPLLSGARLLCANSANTAGLLRRRGLKEERITVVCPGVTPPPTPDARPSETIMHLLADTAGRPTLVTVGRLVRRKGILEFIRDVMPRLRDQVPGILYLVAGGEPKASLIHHERIADRIADTIRDQDLGNTVRLLGRISDADLAEVYGRSDLFILPCLDDPDDVEGFGIVILEAALRRVPAVATRCGGIPDAIADGATGLLVTPGRPDELANAITGLLNDPDRRTDMGEAARCRTLETFTWDAVAARYADALASAITRA